MSIPGIVAWESDNCGLAFEIVWHERMSMPNTIIMKSFIEDYLQDPGQAIADAVSASKSLGWSDNIDEDLIYAQIASGEFRLYEDIVIS